MGFFDSDVEYGDAYNLPTDYKSGLKDILGEAKKLYESRKETGYQDYPGERIAGFTPEELAAMQGISGLVGAGAKYFDPATDLAKGLGERFTADTAQSYMNPYQQSVVDVEKRKAREDFDQTMQGIGTKAVGAGSFGGSRQAILEGEATSDLGQRLGDIQAIGTKQAFDDARKAFEAQKGRERLSGSALASLGQQAPNQALKELTALAGVGEAGRGMEQNKYDMAYQNFLDRQNFAGNALGDYAGMVYGFPTQGFQKQTQGFSKPSSFQNLMGVIGAGKSLFPSFGFSEGGHIAFRSNGGLSGLMTPQTIDAIVENDFEDEPVKTSTPSKKDMIQKYLEQLLKGGSNVTDEYAKALKAQAEIANIKKKKLEDRGFMDRLGEFAQGVAEGYDPTRPQSMTGSLAAGAKAVKSDDQILQERADIEEQLAKGQIGLAEAKVKLANLNLKTFTALNKLTKNPFEFEGPSNADMKPLIKGYLGSEGSKTFSQDFESVMSQALNLARTEAMKRNITNEGMFNNLVKEYAVQIAKGLKTKPGNKVTDNIKKNKETADKILKDIKDGTLSGF